MGRAARVAPLLVAAIALGTPAVSPGSALAASSRAVAQKKTVAPPGNSGVSQYVEDLPTGYGNKPTSSVVVPPAGGSGGSGSGGTGSGSTVIPKGVLKKLSRAGSAGKAAAAVAEATAPAIVIGKSKPSVQSPEAPATSVIKALSGSTGGGGLGSLLPLFLIAALVVVSAVGLVQRRRSS